MKIKLSQIIALLLASGILMSCTADKQAGTTTSSKKDEQPMGAITPGDADKHLVENEGVYTLYSPDGTLAISVDTKGEEYLTYNVTSYKNGSETEWVKSSQMGVSAENIKYFYAAQVESAKAEHIKNSFALNGNQRTVEGNCMQATLTLKGRSNGGSCTLELRAYDNGVAFRYNLPNVGKSVSNLKELTTYSLRTDLKECWYGAENQDYESVISSHSPVKKSDERITAPLTAVLKNNKGYISIMEGALTDSYPGVNLKAEGKATYSTTFYTTPKAGGKMTSAWRLINIADDLNGLVNNYNVYTVNEEPGELYSDTGWIQPGRSAWSWCMTHGAPTPEQMKQYTLNAAMLGYEYNIIDDGWPAWKNYKSELTQLGELGNELNVKQLLWGAITVGSDGYNKMPTKTQVNAYMKLLEDTGMKGAKVDFWWSEANTDTTALQIYILEEAAKREFVIDFHGCNKNSGLDVSYPNELSREGVRGLENIGAANTTNYGTYASWLNAQLYTRFLCGHADWTPATYNVMEIASLICIDSPLMVVASDPADILKSPALEFIKSIPTVWDRTVVLSDSEIGKYSVYAKENKGTWFVGGIASANISSAKVKLSEFLPDDGAYNAEIWIDKNGKMEVQNITVSSKDTIDIGKLSSGQGYAIRLSKLSLDKFGGMIGNVNVTAPSTATVKYTTDGSSPESSPSAKTVDGAIKLTESCILRVAIVSGDGKGHELSYRFNEIDPVHTFDYKLSYEDFLTTLSMTAQEGTKIHYTLDGTAPTESSPLYEKEIHFEESCTVKYLVLSQNARKDGSIDIRVRKPLTAPLTQIPLTNAKPISARTDWGNIHYDSSMAVDNGMSARKITLGGTDLNSGTSFDKGISANANASFVYEIPEGAKAFAALCGIDDCVYNNKTDGVKASARLIISFDGVTAYTSDIFRLGQYVTVNVQIPEGAKQMTITFSDAGDGITCDNVSLAAPGWVTE